MARQTKQVPPQPAEDMFGRPTDVRHEAPAPGPSREQQAAPRPPKPVREDEAREPTNGGEEE